MPILSKIGALRLVNREEWSKKIRKTMKEHGGRVPDAAAALEISTRQLFRWLAELSDIPRVENGMPRDGWENRRKKPKVTKRRRVKK